MRPLGKNEADALLAASWNGMLELSSLPGYDGGIPPVKYAECTKGEDGALSWEAKHLPFVSKWDWDGYCGAMARESSLMLTKDERTEMIKAYIRGAIDEDALPRIYPLQRRPILAAVLYSGFGDDARFEDMPMMPETLSMQFDGWAPGEAIGIWDWCEFIDKPSLYERGKYQRECKPYDWSTGQPIDDSMVYLYDNLLTCISLYISSPFNNYGERIDMGRRPQRG